MTTRRLARPEALRGAKLDRNAVIEASAGTGKTFTLEHLVVELVLGGATMDQILVVTFTEKATTELRQRVRSKLEELVSDREGAELPSGPGEYLTIDDAARAKLERALHGYDGATIATIHAFCQRVLRDNAFASGRLFEEQQVDGRDAFARALRDVLRRDIAADPARARWLEAALADGWSMARLEDLLWRCTAARCEILPPFDPAACEAIEAALDELDTAAMRPPARWSNCSGGPFEGRRRRRSCLGCATWPTWWTGCERQALARRASSSGQRRWISPTCATRSPPLGETRLARQPAPLALDARAVHPVSPGRHRADDARSPPRRAGPSQARGGSVRFRRHAPPRRRRASRPTGRGASLVDARAMALRPHRRVPGHGRDPVVDLPTCVLRAPFEKERPLPRGGSQAVDLPLPRCRRGYVPRRHGRRSYEAGGLPIRLQRNYRATQDLVEATNALLDQRAPQPFFSGTHRIRPRRFAGGRSGSSSTGRGAR